MSKIYFCGEVVADLLEKVEGSGDFKFLLGGSQFNGATGASRAVKRENLTDKIQIGFVGPMSQDTFGERFYASLTNNGIDASGVIRVDRNTTLAIISIRPGKENAFSFYGRDTAEQMTKIEDLPTALGGEDEKRICCFGSISTVMEPARFAWLEFANRFKKNALVCYDLNTRPTIAKDPERYRGLVLEWARIAHVMKASDADIGWAYPDMSMQDVAKIWLDAGASMAVFTKGLHGSEAYTKTVSASASTLDLELTNTVGAGDNFNAGLAIAFSKNDIFSVSALEALTQESLQSLLQNANETAAYHLISIGAKPRNVA
ncbi:MAG: PfkB family carbohydrate kinase [Bdellovibrionales bacterium]|jgi:fructokinase